MDKSKSKKIITIILIISAFLGLAAIGTSYYYAQIADVTPQESSAAQGCGCYYLDSSAGVNSCADADPKMAYAFKTGTIQSDGSCSANCDERLSPEIVDNGLDQQIIRCEIKEGFSATPGCIDLSIENSQGERFTNSIDPTDELKIKAKFNVPPNLGTEEGDFYEGFSIIVNGTKSAIAVEDAAKTGSGLTAEYVASMDVSDFEDADTLVVQAFGDSIVGTEYSSSACLRELKINQSQVPICRSLDLSVSTDDNDIPVVEDLTIETSALGDVETLTATFKLGDSETAVTTDDLTSKYLDGTILLDETFLYNSANFTSSKDFSELDDSTSSVDVSAVLTVNGEEIDSDACVASERFTTTTPTDEEEDPDGNGTDEEEEDPDVDPNQTTDQSTFTTEKDASVACIEREAPDNDLTYTITITNGDDAFQDISKVVDKLPLGFEYVDESTVINGTAVDDADYLTVETVGSAQQLTWETDDGWSIDADDSMTIAYEAIATDDALTGEALNEVVVTPVNTPVDPDTLRTEVSVEVAQSCSAPETGLFDDTQGRIIFSVMIIILGALFYNTGMGIAFSEKVAGNKLYQGVLSTAQMFGWKLTQPRKYFEEKSIRRIEKKRRSNRS